MSFYGKMAETANNVSITENGMRGYKTTYHPLLDVNFALSSYRHENDDKIREDITKIIASEDATYILKYLFFVRDAREGLGERRFFKVALNELIKSNFKDKDKIITDLINNEVAKYGRYDDLFLFVGTDYEQKMIQTVLAQLRKDFDNMTKKQPISLLAKWMPSENASSKETIALAKKFIKAFGASPREYRKLLSALRDYLNVLEVKTSGNQWGDIDYNAVPSKANLKYKDAFLRHDEERRRDYLAALRVGVDKDGNAVKINSTVNFPHEIVSKYRTTNYWSYRLGNYDEALEQLWKNLKNKEGLENTIVVRDGSGSMTCSIGNGQTTALDVSTALSIYCAERLKGDFKDKFITFSSQARLVDLSGNESLHAKLATCFSNTDCSNTNLGNVFQLILDTARDHKMSQDEIPSQVLIISDMEFDSCGGRGSGNVIEFYDKAFKNAGYTLPKLVFWNVNSRTNTIPCRFNDEGVLLVSGFSVNVLDMVMSGKTDPFDALVEKILCETYKEIPLIEVVKDLPKKEATKPQANTKKAVKPRKVEKPSWL